MQVLRKRNLLKMLRSVFDTIYPVRDKYMLGKYPLYHKIIGYLIKTKLEEIVFPSNYYICIKKASSV